MSFAPDAQPAIVLVDDDSHSARLMVRMLGAHGGPEVERIADPAIALESIAGLAAAGPGDERLMVIVDLKSSSTATRDFIARLKAAAANVLVVAMAPSLDKATRDQLLNAGAAAVFERHADLNLYRREAACIVAFWVRGQRLNAVGT
jgi:CheY-like chemotaxis protein